MDTAIFSAILLFLCASCFLIYRFLRKMRVKATSQIDDSLALGHESVELARRSIELQQRQTVLLEDILASLKK